MPETVWADKCLSFTYFLVMYENTNILGQGYSDSSQGPPDFVALIDA